MEHTVSNLQGADALGEASLTALDTHATIKASWTDYIALTKPRIISLLLVTTLAAMVIATRGLPPARIVLATLLAGAMMAGGANAMNCSLDHDMDRLMSRTRRRPVASDRVAPRRAAVFALVLAAGAFFIQAGVNWLSAWLSLAGFVVYVLVYTLWLKRTSPSAVLIGGFAGAIPPLVGWAAATGHIGLYALDLFAIIVFWQVPHTWALSLLLKDDYARAGVPVLPVAAGESETHRQILLYTILLFGVTLLPFATGLFGNLYLIAALLLGGRLAFLAWRLLRHPGQRAEAALYKYSLLYLALLFAMMAIDRIL